MAAFSIALSCFMRGVMQRQKAMSCHVAMAALIVSLSCSMQGVTQKQKKMSCHVAWQHIQQDVV